MLKLSHLKIAMLVCYLFMLTACAKDTFNKTKIKEKF